MCLAGFRAVGSSILDAGSKENRSRADQVLPHECRSARGCWSRWPRVRERVRHPASVRSPADDRVVRVEPFIGQSIQMSHVIKEVLPPVVIGPLHQVFHEGHVFFAAVEVPTPTQQLSPLTVDRCRASDADSTSGAVAPNKPPGRPDRYDP